MTHSARELSPSADAATLKGAAPYRGLLTPSGRVPNFARLQSPEFQAGLSVANERIAAFLARGVK